MRDAAWCRHPGLRLLRRIAAGLLVVLAPTAVAQPLLPEQPPPAPLRAAWEEAGRPVVLIVPDHLGLDARAALYGRALREAGLSMVALDLPPWPGNDRWSPLLPAAPDNPGAAETMLPVLAEALRRLAPEGSAIGVGGGRRIGVLGFGPGGEAALLAAHAGMLGGATGVAAHAALYPTCAGPRLPALRGADAPTTGAPVLAIIPHAGGAGDMPGGCAVLFDGWEPLRTERVTVLPFDSLGYGFDLWTAAGLEAARRGPGDPPGIGGGGRAQRAGIGNRGAPPGDAIDPLRFDVLRTLLARESLVRFFRAALVPPEVELPVSMARARRPHSR